MPTATRLSVCLGVTLLCLAAGCNRGAPPKVAPKPAEVIVQKAAYEEVTDVEDFTGRLEAFKRVDLQATRVTGYLQKMHFTEGGLVEEGKVLFEIDPSTYQADLRKAEAALVQAQARLKRLDNDLTRANDLFRTKSIAKAEYDQVVGDHAEAAAAERSAEAARVAAEVTLGYTRITAPKIEGLEAKYPRRWRISRTMVDPGSLIKGDMTVLTTLVTEDPVFAYFDVDERTHIKLARLRSAAKSAKKGTTIPVFLALADEEGFPHKGVIDFTDTVIDPATGTKRMRGLFQNVFQEDKALFTPGMFVRVRLQIGEPHPALVISEQAVGTDQGEKFVYVVNDKNKVEYRKVKVGALTKGKRVIESGVSQGERVIVSGVMKVRTNAEVVPLDGPPPEEKAAAPPKITILEKK